MTTSTDPTLAAVERVAQDVRDLRTDLSGRLDQVITRAEHAAEVRRIDSEHRTLAEKHAALSQAANVEHTALRQLIEADQESRVRSADEHRRERAADRRVYLQVTVAAVIGAASIVGTLVSIFAR